MAEALLPHVLTWMLGLVPPHQCWEFQQQRPRTHAASMVTIHFDLWRLWKSCSRAGINCWKSWPRPTATSQILQIASSKSSASFTCYEPLDRYWQSSHKRTQPKPPNCHYLSIQMWNMMTCNAAKKRGRVDGGKRKGLLSIHSKDEGCINLMFKAQ